LIVGNLSREDLRHHKYDPDSINDSFFQVAELMKNGTAKVISMTMNTDVVGGYYPGKKTITFEVDIWDSP
jgi:hypothetical protein